MSQVPTIKAAALADALTRKVAESAETLPAPTETKKSPVGRHTIDVGLLNRLYHGELEAIHQYGAHYAIAINLGYLGYAANLQEHLDDERRHAAMLAKRIVLIGGTLVVTGAIDATVGTDVILPFII